MKTPVYLDNHATTAVDPRVVDAMLPYFSDWYGNAGSTTHEWGRQARAAVDQARGELAEALGVAAEELVFTSGATESNNLAIRGLVERHVQSGRAVHLVSVVTEHRAVLDPLARCERAGHAVTRLPVTSQDQPDCGQVDLDQLVDALRPETRLVSVMLANNEIGVIQPPRQITSLCHMRGVLVHCDATQAVGKIPVSIPELDVDLLSFSAHKLHGPKGIGALVVRERSPRIRLAAQIDGGGQERGLRSGTLPVPLIVGFATAVKLACSELTQEMPRWMALRQRLYEGLRTQVHECHVNGPLWQRDDQTDPIRLPNNLNLRFPGLDGEAILLHAPGVALSTGSACSAASPEPSHVLRAIGLNDGLVRSSIRFGLSRFTTAEEIDFAVDCLAQAIRRLLQLA